MFSIPVNYYVDDGGSGGYGSDGRKSITIMCIQHLWNLRRVTQLKPNAQTV